jgi:hypothetical protein
MHRMPATMPEPEASTDRHPVFVDDRRVRNRVGRLATTAFGLLLAAWLAALAAGVIGSGPFPQLALLGADQEQAVPMRPQTSDDPAAGRAASRSVAAPSRSNSETPGAAGIHRSTGTSSTGEAGGTSTGGDGAPRPTAGPRETPTQIQPPGETTTETPSAEAPTPPESGQQTAISSRPSVTTAPDISSGTTSPDGSDSSLAPTVGASSTDSPDAPIDGSVPTG